MALDRYYLFLYFYLLRLSFSIQYFLLPPIMFGNSFKPQYTEVGYQNCFSEFTRVLDYQFFKNVLDYIKLKLIILQIYELRPLFHILLSDSFSYWDKRILYLSLPIGFKYR